MGKTKYTLSFVNNGKEFELSDWTLKKHKEVLREVTKYENEKLTEKELDEKYRHILILKGLHEVDPNVTEEDLLSMHPDDLIALFTAVYYQGRKGIVVQDFQKKSRKNLSKK